jgi:hypothetical protein
MDIQISYSWFDERLDFTGENELEVPAFEWLDSSDSMIPWVHDYEMLPPPIWIPSFQFLPPANDEDFSLDDFMTIQNVS